MTKAGKSFSSFAPSSCMLYQKVLLETFSGKGSMQFLGLLLRSLCVADFLYDDGEGAAQRLFVLSGHRESMHEFLPRAQTSIKSTHAGALKT